MSHASIKAATTVSRQNEWSIELLRGVAALMVVYAHYHPLAGIDANLTIFTFTGVDLFFVISGFVFAPYFFGKNLEARPFFIRRFFRIYPLYVVGVAVYALIQVWQGGRADYLLEHLLFLHTFKSPEIAFFYNPAFWSLPPEVEYYLLVPLLALFVRRASSLFMLVAAALVMRGVIAHSSPVDGAITTWFVLGVHIPGLLVEFLIGTLAWMVVTRSPGVYLRLAMLITGIALWVGLAKMFSVLGDPGVLAHPLLRGNLGLFAAIAYGLILCGFVGLIKSPPGGLLMLATVVGNLSYGVYLFHNAMPRLLSGLSSSMHGLLFALLCLLATLLVAWLAHAVIESPARNFGRQWSARIQQRGRITADSAVSG